MVMNPRLTSKKVLLISLLRGEHRNISCLSLYSYIKHNGVDVSLLFIPDRKSINVNKLASFLSLHKFSIVGFSVMTGDYYFACDLTRVVRNTLNSVHITWGGIHPTSVPDECIEMADSICIGEGERALLELAKASDGNISGIKNLWVKCKDGRIIKNGLSDLVDLNALPAKRYSWEDFYVLDVGGVRAFGLEDYARYSKHGGDGYTLMTSRSCPYSCSFCINSFLHKIYPNQNRARKSKVGLVIEELEQALRSIPSVRFINFIDDHFLSSNKWTDDFVSQYGRKINLPFMIRSTPEFISAESIKSLKLAGLAVIQIGIQSGSYKTNKEIYHRRFGFPDYQ